MTRLSAAQRHTPESGDYSVLDVDKLIFSETTIQQELAKSSSPEHPATDPATWFKYFGPLWLMAPYYAGTPDASLISSLPLHTTGLGANPANGYVFTWLDRFDVRRDPNAHQGFGGGGRHFCLGAGLARLELKLWIEENLRRSPEIELAGDCERVSSTFLNQYLHIPVKVG